MLEIRTGTSKQALSVGTPLNLEDDAKRLLGLLSSEVYNLKTYVSGEKELAVWREFFSKKMIKTVSSFEKRILNMKH